MMVVPEKPLWMDYGRCRRPAAIRILNWVNERRARQDKVRPKNPRGQLVNVAGLLYTQWVDEYPDALAVCDGCPVRQACLAHAFEMGEMHGVWGGTTGEERMLLKEAKGVRLMLLLVQLNPSCVKPEEMAVELRIPVMAG